VQPARSANRPTGTKRNGKEAIALPRVYLTVPTAGSDGRAAGRKPRAGERRVRFRSVRSA
jgi:hypothetical protein